MASSFQASGSSASGSTHQPCECGIPSKIRKARCEFFDWIDKYKVNECVGCKSLSTRINEVEKTMSTLVENVNKMKTKNAGLEASNEELQKQVSQLIVENNKHLGGKIVVVAALVATWVLVIGWELTPF